MTHRNNVGKLKTADISSAVVLRLCNTNTGLYTQQSLSKLIVCHYWCHKKAALQAIKREILAGRLEYGTSLDYPWLTEKGTRFLHFFESEQLPPAKIEALLRKVRT